MRHKIKAAIIAFGALGALAGTAGAQPYQDGTYDQGYGNQGYGQGYDQNYGPELWDRITAPATTRACPATGQGYGQAKVMRRTMHRSRAISQHTPAPSRVTASRVMTRTADGYASNDRLLRSLLWLPRRLLDLPVYDGAVLFDGGWYNGPFFWRDFGGHREFWIHGGWRGGQFRGGHFGAALGRDFFARRGIGTFAHGGNFGRGNFGHQNFARFAPQRSFQQPAFNGFRGGFAGRTSFNAQPRAGFGGFEGRGGGGWNHGGGGGGHGGGGHGGGGGFHGGGHGGGGHHH